jgi:putative PIN family toxin of toxin-antitoxin system
MLRVVIDTNILVSAALSAQGAPARIFELILERKTINYTSKPILEEIYRVFARPKFTSLIAQEDIVNLLKKYIESSVIIVPTQRINVIKDDPQDNRFLECALEAGAEYLVTGDRHILKLSSHKSVKIICAKDFLSLVI